MTLTLRILSVPPSRLSRGKGIGFTCHAQARHIEGGFPRELLFPRELSRQSPLTKFCITFALRYFFLLFDYADYSIKSAPLILEFRTGQS
jgi:hypothetical protein